MLGDFFSVLVMSEFKIDQEILSLKSLIVASLTLKYKEVLESPSLCTHQAFKSLKTNFKIYIKEDMKLELERGLELFFSNFFLKTNYGSSILSSSSCVFCIAPFTSDAQRTFVTHQFACQNDTKITQFG